MFSSNFLFLHVLCNPDFFASLSSPLTSFYNSFLLLVISFTSSTYATHWCLLEHIKLPLCILLFLVILSEKSTSSWMGVSLFSNLISLDISWLSGLLFVTFSESSNYMLGKLIILSLNLRSYFALYPSTNAIICFFKIFKHICSYVLIVLPYMLLSMNILFMTHLFLRNLTCYFP